jgi:predicted TIM-barrel fold metal-dependent hydrolase
MYRGISNTMMNQDDNQFRWYRTLALFITLFSVGSCCFGPVITPSALPEQKIIDMHCHTAGIGAGNSGCFVSKKLKDSYKFSVYLKAFGVDKEQLEKEGDALIVKKISEKISTSKFVGASIVLALDGVINQDGTLNKDKTEVYIPNDFVSKETSKYENLYFGASINPNRKDALALLEQVAKENAKLIKWLPPVQEIDPSNIAYIPFYKKMVELNLPLLTHTGDECSFTHTHNAYGDPALLELPLKMGVTVIAAHVATTGHNGGKSNFNRFMALVDKYPNLYADISSLTQINKHGHLSDILKHKKLQPRLIYGSDYPLIETLLVSSYFYPLRLSPVSMWRLGQHDNAWDHDVKLKQALGVPTEVFQRSRTLFLK